MTNAKYTLPITVHKGQQKRYGMHVLYNYWRRHSSGGQSPSPAAEDVVQPKGTPRGT